MFGSFNYSSWTDTRQVFFTWGFFEHELIGKDKKGKVVPVLN
jgi:hypothetical protein